MLFQTRSWTKFSCFPMWSRHMLKDIRKRVSWCSLRQSSLNAIALGWSLQNHGGDVSLVQFLRVRCLEFSLFIHIFCSFHRTVCLWDQQAKGREVSFCGNRRDRVEQVAECKPAPPPSKGGEEVRWVRTGLGVRFIQNTLSNLLIQNRGLAKSGPQVYLHLHH